MIAAWWRLLAIVLAVLLLTVGAIGGTGWWLAAAARDKAQADLTTERSVSGQLRAGIDDQNRAIKQLGDAQLAAEARGVAAMQQAAAAGKRFDDALRRMDGARVTTCADAMPFVNQMLEDVR
ncbi:hypothetical protein GJ700_12775 [Duganella sp. FT92W]|uniref:Uncharacterized protein n=1 Tax=Pseudoduganella rivuli TaxID=2666085 RepID=A0A7X2IM71_9BURK|nr:hypothetical protein [Pseudoduganella rivuli]MRV72582.1 hypothetical protein [Pseudoduganella rivuli]